MSNVMDIDMFYWDAKTKCLSQEMSTIWGNGGFRHSKVLIQGEKLVHPVEFTIKKTHYDRENELTHWTLTPKDAALANTGLHLIVWND